MEDVMKSPTLLRLAVALSGTGLHAQSLQYPGGVERSQLGRLQSYQESHLHKLKASLLNSLSHDVEGVVLSALRDVAKIALARPSCIPDQLVSQVNDLARKGVTAAIRYKAYLTSNVLSTPYVFASEGLKEFQTDEQFFTALARRMETLALRDDK
jgi:hypothetical protein